MRLVLLHPALAARSCNECQEFLFHDSPDGMGGPVERNGERVRRAKGQRLACSYCPKQPPDVPEKVRTPGTAIELTAENWQAYQHYRECKAVGQFPDDAIVRQNAAIIRQAEEVADSVRRIQLAMAGQIRG